MERYVTISRLHPSLKHHVERSLSRPADRTEPALLDHFRQPSLARLSTQPEPNFLDREAGVQKNVDAE